VLLLVLLLVLLPLLGGCSTVGYLGHVGKGHAALLRQQQPIEQLVASPTTAPELREQLLELAAAREFASRRLLLPDNRSYTRYVALDREHVSWVVIAAPEFSLDPVPLCLLISGCVPYRGYFSRERADRAAAALAARGLDTWVGGVSAYSTLGWFADPVVSSMLHGGTDAAIGVMFHELTHQWLYLRGDSAFNESLASFVEQQGLREWRAERGLPSPATGDGRAEAFRGLVQALLDELQALYDSGEGEAQMRKAKAAAIEAFRRKYRIRRESDWSAFRRFDRWVDEPINNASLQSQRLYETWVPAFDALFEQAGSDWQRFQREVQRLAGLRAKERRFRLEQLLAQGRNAADAGDRSRQSPSTSGYRSVPSTETRDLQ